MWLDAGDPQLPQATMTDVVFRLHCTHLPVDHAQSLADAISVHAPQLNEQPSAGVHPIHVAGSQNGWERPDNEDQTLVLSKRTRLRIRTRLGSDTSLIEQLSGVTLDIAGFPLEIVSGQVKPITPAST
ncbi:MAG: type I-MYXAN CRISPR-associated protein Cas6/Cmx6, partial [Granulosicoccus sp.]|nr:type I-MYXAN CRISPR-associated protein Cas6/Cmx6 [Granulosicoccus sp.]